MTAKLVSVQSVLTGEVATIADDPTVGVPFSSGFNLDALKLVDDDPFFVTVVVREGKGDQGSGVYYDGDVLKSIAEQINNTRPPGYKGHQDPEKVSWEYREPVTAWVGARHSVGADGKAELRVKGYVPPTAQDLRTQLKLAESGADVVNSVSIWGIRTEEGNRVTDFDLISLDWTPKGRAGMETELVGVSGEQVKEDEMTRDEVIASLKSDEVPAHLVDGFRQEGRDSLASDTTIAGEMRVIFELDDEADSDAVINAVRSLVGKTDLSEFEERVDKAVGEQVTVEFAVEAVRDAVLGTLSPNATDEEVTGEITSVLDRPYVKALVGGSAIPTIQGGAGGDNDSRQATAWT